MLFRKPAPRFYVNARAIIERETPQGTEVLLQRREKSGEPRRLEFPGGQLEPFEGILTALLREVREETGLTVTALLDPPNERVSNSSGGEVECLTPSFVYQTRRGPVDSVGFFFRVWAEGELTRAGDHAAGHSWVPLADLRRRLDAEPETFDWLTQGALGFYLQRAWA
ncbi:NUDIX domain-containing protein [Deinococcus sp. NW-56]|uniref:NUDIX domain-containing protein n=1 Tax=Deinococcus sp. NW-56 TaxID=2080419 RepID=UPI001319EE61|nr:NUDIX hydrolase [Deinococcus sp. NW-56]